MRRALLAALLLTGCSGIRAALGDSVASEKELKVEDKYSDVNYHSRDNKVLTDGDDTDNADAAEATSDEAAPPKKKRGRPRKNPVVEQTL